MSFTSVTNVQHSPTTNALQRYITNLCFPLYLTKYCSFHEKQRKVQEEDEEVVICRKNGCCSKYLTSIDSKIISECQEAESPAWFKASDRRVSYYRSHVG